MKKFGLFLTILWVMCSAAAIANSVFTNQISAQQASKTVPAFENASCQFSQEKLMKTSAVSLKSSGNFKFIKDKGVIFETTYPIQSTSSYTSGQNRIVNSVIKSISDRNYSYLEKNFDIFYQAQAQGWILALKPKSASELKNEIMSIQIFGVTKNSFGQINKIIIDTQSIKTTITFTNCG